MGWLCNYKVGNSYRKPRMTNLTNNFSLEDQNSSYATRVWLMGDGTGDASGNIKNQVNVSGTNADDTRLNLTGVSPQNISGLNIDGVAPTISSVSLNAANSELTVTFSEDVYTNAGSGDLEAADFELSISGGVATVASTPTGITKTAQNIWILDVNVSGTANGSETLSVVPAAGNVIFDLAGNAASTSQSNNTASLTEKILPTVTNVTSTTSDGSYKQGETIAITVVFSETVNVTGTPQLTLNNASGSNAAVDYSSGTGSNTLTFNYTIGSGETSSDLDYVATNSLALNSGTIKDAAGNAATLTLASPGASNSLGNNKALIVDTTVPTVTNVTSTTSDGSYKQGETIAITVVFSETVNVTGTPQLTLNNASGSDPAVNYSSGTGSNTLTFNYTIGSGETSSDLDYVATNSLALNSGTIKDAAGNAATLTLASPGASNSLGNNKALIVDTSVPTISSVSLNAANSELTVTFAENVYDTDGGSGDLEAADFELSISGGVATVASTPTGITKTAQNIWILDVNISGTANGSETLSVVPAAGNVIFDLAGNAASTSQSNNTASLTEKILPTVTNVTSTTSDGSYKQGETIAITVVFSETVNVTGTPQLTLETGGSDAVVDYSSGTGSNTLTFNYTIGSGETSSDLDYVATNSLALNSGTIKDAAGNAATLTLASPGASNSLGNNKALIVDTTVPTVTNVTSTTSDGSYKQGETIAIKVVFSETVNVTGTPQLTLNNASGSNPAVLTVVERAVTR